LLGRGTGFAPGAAGSTDVRLSPSQVADGLRRRERSARWHGWRARRRLLAGRVAGRLDERERETARRLDVALSHRDAMHGGHTERYLGVGLSALRCVEASLDAAGRPEVRRGLDLPCGHGRVLRWLASRFPQAAFTVSDVDEHGIAWCARRFGAVPVRSSPDFDGVDLGEPFELIWCGSLATHLDGPSIGALLRLFSRHLAPDGVAVVTTHGDRAAERMRGREMDYALADPELEGLLRDHADGGFSYRDYPWVDGYGLSLCSRAWFAERALEAGLREALFLPAGWDEHQDAFALVRGA
jgi:SAM-dependent methyltransferase